MSQQQQQQMQLNVDFTYGHSGVWTHYGMMLVGVLYFIESLLWTLDLWRQENN